MCNIPDGEILFKYIHPNALPEGQEEIPKSIFTIQELSCDWARYRPNPYTSFHIDEGKEIVISITACDEIRRPRNPKRKGELVEAWFQDIIHDPVSAEEDPAHGANEAHSLIKGKKKGAVQEAIKDNSEFWSG